MALTLINVDNYRYAEWHGKAGMGTCYIALQCFSCAFTPDDLACIHGLF